MCAFDFIGNRKERSRRVRLWSRMANITPVFLVKSKADPFQRQKNRSALTLAFLQLAVTSDGERIESPKFLRKSEEKLKRKQRAVSKKKRGSNRRRKAVRELARLHEKVANQRKDYAHKESRKLVNEYGLIAFEDLNIQGMVKNHHLAKSITDSGWNGLVQFVTYKAESAGRQVVQVNPYRTSQRCSNCGEIVKKSLAVRVHQCPCGYVADRDENAAINILKLALHNVS